MPIRYIFEPKKGLSNARNRGLNETRGEVILFTDDDVRVPEDWINVMCRPIFEGKADAVQGAVFPAPHLERKWLRGIYKAALAIVEPNPGRAPESLAGANMAFGRHVLNKVELFDIQLGAGASGLGEDTLWGMQLKKAGYRLVYAVGAGVEHYFDETRLRPDYFSSWVTKAGQCSAIMSVSYLRNYPKHPRIIWGWMMFKYLVRRSIDWRRRPVPPEWVMYYKLRAAYAAKCADLMSKRAAITRKEAVNG